MKKTVTKILRCAKYLEQSSLEVTPSKNSRLYRVVCCFATDLQTQMILFLNKSHTLESLQLFFVLLQHSLYDEIRCFCSQLVHFIYCVSRPTEFGIDCLATVASNLQKSQHILVCDPNNSR